MKEHNNRKKADKLAEYITGQELRRYMAEKVKTYCGCHPTVFDGAAGSGQLEQYIKPSRFCAVEIQSEACAALAENYPTAEIHNLSFFCFSDTALYNCAIMNPPFSLKFKELPTEEQAAIQKEYPWKKSGVLDDIFVLKALKFSERYGFFIMFPGVAYRNTERVFRETLGNSVAELNMIRHAFEDTPIEVMFLVVDKQKTTPDTHQEIYCCKNRSTVYSAIATISAESWELPREPAPAAETIDINEINNQLDEMALSNLKTHLENQLIVIEYFNAQIDYLGFIAKVKHACAEYASKYRALTPNKNIKTDKTQQMTLL